MSEELKHTPVAKRVGAAIRGLEFSDSHLLHRRTPAKNTLLGLDKAIYQDNQLANIDIIFIAGDFWDRAVGFPDRDLFDVQQWVRRFVRACAENNVILRVLEGTSYHDWRQSKEFLVDTSGCDVRHVTELSIEHIEALDITVLYLPDEHKTNPEETWQDVLHLLAQHKLEKVDFVVMHGGFHYQFPPMQRQTTHDENRYNGITRYGCFSGHIHQASNWKNIYVAGSFDRTGHGHEERKGYYTFTLDKAHDSFKCTWRENTLALHYGTIDCEGMDADAVLLAIEKYIAKHKVKPASYLRLKNGEADIINGMLSVIKSMYPLLKFDVLNKSHVEEVTTEKRYDESLYQGYNIDRHNIEQALLDYMCRRDMVTDDQIPLIRSLVEELR